MDRHGARRLAMTVTASHRGRPTGMRWLPWLHACLLTLVLLLPAYAEVAVPALAQRVTDLTATLAPDTVSRLESTLAQFEQAKGSQIAVLLVPTTQLEDIAQYGIRVADQWKIGRENVDDGVILIVAKDDRKVRLEVGYGLEGVIPDAVAKRVIEEDIVPRFRQGDFSGGVEAGVTRLMRLIEGEPLPPPDMLHGSAPDLDQLVLPFIVGIVGGAFLGALFGRGLGGFLAGLGAGAWVWASVGVVVLAAGISFFVWLIVMSMGRGGGNWTSGGGRWSGGGGSWGGGGGSWGGGGGGFGGGGASGSW
jgi:uncharacterized protein